MACALVPFPEAKIVMFLIVLVVKMSSDVGTKIENFFIPLCVEFFVSLSLKQKRGSCCFINNTKE